MHGKSTIFVRQLSLSVVLFSLLGVLGVHAQTLKVLHSFGGTGDGFNPLAPMVFDPQGNLYGSTIAGGLFMDGTVFKLAPNHDGTWSETILHSFDTFGDSPGVPLVLDARGNIYGETSGTGGNSYGAVYDLSPNGDGTWSLQTIHTFTNGTDGSQPSGGVVLGGTNQIYGVAENGETRHQGMIFNFNRVSVNSWTELVPHTFTGGSDGNNPAGPLTFDAAGNFYGVSGGGVYGQGTVYKMTPNHRSFGWTKTTLFSFDYTNGSPSGSVILDSAGNIYGTCYEAGPQALGSVYKLSPNGDGSWSEATLYFFQGVRNGDGEYVNSGLVMDAAGNLYGTTLQGGTGCDGYGCGIIFKLTPSANGPWTETILYRFTGGADGSQPWAGLIQDHAGNLYGTTNYGGSNSRGVAYEFIP